MTTFYGFIARIIGLFVPVQKKHWVFGSDYGNMYREGPKYLMEYILKEHPDYACTFITRNPSVKKELDDRGIPCLMNFSLKGILAIAKAECVFTSQVITDVLYAYKKKGRRHFYLVHGQPLKIAICALGQDYFDKIKGKSNILKKLKRKICYYLNEGVSVTDSEFISASSDFLVPFLKEDFGGKVDVKVLGMPRNDVLFQPEVIEKEKWVAGVEGKLVITYMPTHRKYGYGDVTPTPFIDNKERQQWMRDNNVVLLMKQHPNMIPKIKNVQESDVIKDITTMQLDPQVCIYHSDVLVTDYSSVWMDYLLLQRPTIFYYYDDFETEDAGVHYDIRQDPPGHFCYSEDELFEIIKKIKADYKAMCPSDRIVHKFNKNADGNSCERYFNEIIK